MGSFKGSKSLVVVLIVVGCIHASTQDYWKNKKMNNKNYDNLQPLNGMKIQKNPWYQEYNEVDHKPEPVVLPEYHKPVPVVEPDYHKPVPVVVPEYHKPVPVVVPEYYKPIPVVEPDYHKPVPVVVPEYHKPVPVVEPDYHRPVPVVVPEYHKPVPVVVPEYYKPIPVVEPDYHKPVPVVVPEHHKPVVHPVEIVQPHIHHHHGEPFPIQKPVLSYTGEVIVENTVGGLDFNCHGLATGHWRDPNFCDVFHACVHGYHRKTYTCPIVGHRTYFDEKTQKCEFVFANPHSCALNKYVR